ncbi:MAG: hypothetical protein ACKVRP_02245 [Bacteroidota bacterium]
MPSSSNGLRPNHLLFILLLVVITRLPFIWNGYGSDADAWRVADTTKRLWSEGEYTPSRLPGYPLHEFISAPFVALGGAPLSNASTIAATLLLVVVWSRFVAGTARFPMFAVLALAFAPLLWKSSVMTMDYVWSLLCIVLALHNAHKGKAILAGLFLGLATGFRPTNIVAVVPIVVMLYSTTRSARSVALMIAVAGMTCVATFLPLLTKYGLSDWIAETRFQMGDIQLAFTERVLLFGYRGVYAFGPLAAIATGFIVFRKRKTLCFMLQRSAPLLLVACTGLGTYAALFLAFPLEREYLLPALPFLILLIDTLASRNQFILFLACLFGFAFINPDVVRHHGRRGTLGFNLHSGMVFDYTDKLNLVHLHRKAIGEFHLEGKSVVMTGSGPILWLENDALEEDTVGLLRSTTERVYRQKTDPEVRFIDALPLDEVKRLQRDAYTIYCVESMVEYLESFLGYDMRNNDVVILAMPELRLQ